jgi:hypothetical protein
MVDPVRHMGAAKQEKEVVRAVTMNSDLSFPNLEETSKVDVDLRW